MSLTTRDEPAMKSPQTDTSGIETVAPGSDEMTDAEASRPACDVVATLCRMSLVRHRSLSVNGAYVREPPQMPDAV